MFYAILLFLIGAGLVSKLKESRPLDKKTQQKTSTRTTNTHKAKKKPKKKNKKKKAAPSSSSSTSTPEVPPSTEPPQPTQTQDSTSEDSDDSDIPASSILMKRSFAPTSISVKDQKKLQSHRNTQTLNPNPNTTSPLFQVGQRIHAQYRGGQEWFPGTIEKLQKGTKYVIAYDDGEHEYQVSQDKIKSIGDGGTEPAHALEKEEEDEKAEVSDSDSSEEEKDFSEDGWEVVRKKPTTKTTTTVRQRFDHETGNEILTKKQRESRRKKERQRELKQEMRSSAQEKGLHAKWGGTYNPAKKGN